MSPNTLNNNTLSRTPSTQISNLSLPNGPKLLTLKRTKNQLNPKDNPAIKLSCPLKLKQSPCSMPKFISPLRTLRMKTNIKSRKKAFKNVSLFQSPLRLIPLPGKFLICSINSSRPCLRKRRKSKISLHSLSSPSLK